MNRPVRRSQAISPFGIGALVDFPGPVSLVHAGLDAWPFTEGNIRSHCPDWGIDPLAILPALSEKLEGKRGDTDHGSNTCQDTLIESDYRREEYRIFCRDMQEGYPKTNLLIRSSDLKNYGELAISSFDRISLLHKLRETRAFVGFSRIFPDELTQEEQWKLITREKKRWLPAV
ncbi:MAG: hypothetical protein WCJ49_07560, partial [Deltaproteobacteria bacterium]